MKQLVTLCILLSVCSPGLAATSVLQLQKDWALANYALQRDEHAFTVAIGSSLRSAKRRESNAHTFTIGHTLTSRNPFWKAFRKNVQTFFEMPQLDDESLQKQTFIAPLAGIHEWNAY